MKGKVNFVAKESKALCLQKTWESNFEENGERTELRAMSRRKVIDKKITKEQMDVLVLLQRKLQLCWQQQM